MITFPYHLTLYNWYSKKSIIK